MNLVDASTPASAAWRQHVIAACFRNQITAVMAQNTPAVVRPAAPPLMEPRPCHRTSMANPWEKAMADDEALKIIKAARGDRDKANAAARKVQ
jgi:hypothetical protein